jgi:hypothetical protein
LAPLRSSALGFTAPLYAPSLGSSALLCARFHCAPLRSASLRSAPLHSSALGFTAPLYAPLRSAPLRSSALGFTALLCAPLHCASLRSASLRFTALLCAPLCSASLRPSELLYARLLCAPLRSASLRLNCVPFHSASLRSSVLRSTALQLHQRNSTEAGRQAASPQHWGYAPVSMYSRRRRRRGRMRASKLRYGAREQGPVLLLSVTFLGRSVVGDASWPKSSSRRKTPPASTTALGGFSDMTLTRGVVR